MRYEDLIESITLNRMFKESFKQLNKSFWLIQTKAIESQKHAYKDVLNKTYIDVSCGIYSYNEAIKRGIKSMAQKGLKGATYDGTIISYSIEATVRRNTLTATHQITNRTLLTAANELECNYINIYSHIGARVNDTNPIVNHAGWQGKQ